MLSGYQSDTARIAVWLLSRFDGAAAAWVEAQPATLAQQAGLAERAAREATARLVSRGFVALERRGGSFWLAPTAAGRGPLNAYVLGFAAECLGSK